jgi:hypothetical protein
MTRLKVDDPGRRSVQPADADNVWLMLGHPLRTDPLDFDAVRARPSLELVEPGQVIARY